MNTTNSKTAAEAEAEEEFNSDHLYYLLCDNSLTMQEAKSWQSAFNLPDTTVLYDLFERIHFATPEEVDAVPAYSAAEPEGADVVPFNTEAEAEQVHSDFGPDHMLGAEREMMREIQASPAVRDDFLSIYSMTEAKLEQRIADIAECDRLGLPDDMPLTKALHRIYVDESKQASTNHVKEGSNSAA